MKSSIFGISGSRELVKLMKLLTHCLGALLRIVVK
jgi:hypothetical protein